MAAFLSANSHAQTSFVIHYNGIGDPLNQGFTTTSFGGSSSVALVTNDLGQNGWSIAGNSQVAQFGYGSGALSSAQMSAALTEGFSLDITARAILGSAPFFDTTNATIGSVQVNIGAVRWDIEFGLNSNGDTVVVLPNSIDGGGPGNSVRAFGSSYTLTGSGSSYHTYQLVFDPTAASASLFVDGVERLSGYTGNTTFVTNLGMIFGVNSGGQGNFSFAELAVPASAAAIPEPASCGMVAGTLLLGYSLFQRFRDRVVRSADACWI